MTGPPLPALLSAVTETVSNGESDGWAGGEKAERLLESE